MTKQLSLINGPNLNLLGTREPEIYGSETLKDIESSLSAQAKTLGYALVCKQSNVEGELVTFIQEARSTGSLGIIINPAAYTHTSIAIMDALSAVALPVVEVHLSNVHARERFRHHSYVSRVASGVICGFGTKGYSLALEALVSSLSDT